MTTALKPCPFCGGSAYVDQVDPYPYSFVQFRAGCMPCGICMSHGDMKTRETAAKHWNKRFADQQKELCGHLNCELVSGRKRDYLYCRDCDEAIDGIGDA